MCSLQTRPCASQMDVMPPGSQLKVEMALWWHSWPQGVVLFHFSDPYVLLNSVSLVKVFSFLYFFNKHFLSTCDSQGPQEYKNK